MRAVVGGVEHDGVVGDAQLVEQVQHLADVAVVLDHAVGEDAESGDALALLLQVRVEVHARGRQPGEPGRARFVLVLMKSMARPTNSSSAVSMRFLVSGPVSSHCCLPIGPKRGSSVARPGRGLAVEDAARAEFGAERRVLRIVRVLGLLLGVQVVEVAEELVEAVHGRQELVAVTEMVLAELAGGVAERLEQLGEGRVLLLQADGRRPASRPWSGPVRIGDCPVMKAERPAVQLCSA